MHNIIIITTDSVIDLFSWIYLNVQSIMAEDNNRRYPPNLRGLLNFCTEYTQTEDAPSASSMSVMPEEVVFSQVYLYSVSVGRSLNGNILSSHCCQTYH